MNDIRGYITPKGTVTGYLGMGGGGGHFPYYDGDYIVTPKTTEQTLATARKSMRSDVTVEAIPYSEVSNPAGGNTVNIAYIS